MTTADILNALGWRTSTSARLTQAIRDFQLGWNLGGALAVDGIDGPKTQAALDLSMQRRKEGKPDFSEHFSAREFACACGGSNADCRRIWATRYIVQTAEALRTILGPFTPRTGCRCTVENARVGGAKKSQHLYGSALDLGTNSTVYDISPAAVRALGRVSGIGYYVVSGRQVVRHVDTRHASGVNETKSSTSAPAMWEYGNFGTRTLIKPRPDLAKPPAPKPEPAPEPKPVEEERTLTPAQEEWRQQATGARILKDRTAPDPETAPRIPLGLAVENLTDLVLELHEKVAALQKEHES